MFEALGAADLVDAIREKERIAARAMAEQAELIAALHQRQVMLPEDRCDTVLDRAAMVEAELAAALHVSSRAAGTRVEAALALIRRLPGDVGGAAGRAAGLVSGADHRGGDHAAHR